MRRASYLAVIAAALVIGAYGSWVLWQGIEVRHWQSDLFGVASIAASLGMLARQPWSRFLVYLVVAFFCVSWVAAIIDAVNAGAWEKFDALRIFLSLVPGLGMVLVALVCAFVAARFLRPASVPA
jgi:hypothetical protein